MSYFDPYAFYDEMPLSDENALSSQLWDLYAPTSDTQAWNRINAAYPNMKGFSVDALLQSDPLIRGIASQAISEAGSGVDAPFTAYNLMQSKDYQDQLRDMLGRTEWNDIMGRGDIGTIIANASGDSKATDQAAMDYTNGLLEDFYSQAAPTAARNMGFLDEGQQRFGGRPYPGGGAPQFGGPAFSQESMAGVPDMMMSNPAYANAGVAGVVDPRMLPQVQGDSPLAQYSHGSQAMYQGEPILDLGKADVSKTRVERNLGPEGYSTVAVIGGRKFALPDTLPGPGGTSLSYMDELRKRADAAGLEFGPGAELMRPHPDDEGDMVEAGGGPGYFNRMLDRAPGLGDIRQWIRDRLPRGMM